MDPLTALGLASNVLSFVSFASGLIKGTLEIRASTTGFSIDIARLEVVCGELQDLCDGLQSSSEHRILGARAEDHVTKVFVAVKSLSASCKADGDELLQIINALRVKSGSKGRWDSFKAALKTAWEKSRIDELETRLSRTQITITLHICTLAQYCSRIQSERLESLQQQSLSLQADQGTVLKRISDELADLQNGLQFGQDPQDSPNQQGHFTVDDVERLQEKLQSLSLSAQDLKKQQAILQSLTFESRPVRHEQIAIAHEKTFRWALATDQDSTFGPSIGAWLKQGDGIFWVSGKPGSGKSTLMKYIADSTITSRLIAEWAQPCRAAIVSHYFWIAGTTMQKSQQGLLQTLLYEIFRQCPDLIERTCMERWNSSEPEGPWSLIELHDALRTFTTRRHDSLKLCFIIDGLDEYSGDHEDRTQLCRTLKGLATTENVKLCLSSRPWNVFEEEFGLEFPKIYMQDLTRDDIRDYALSRLEEHKRWATVSANHSQGQWLVSEIAAKSNGVFLWVFLVTKLLREGLTNRDSFVDLRRRLESFPSELEPFFKNMLEAVEPFYHSHMSTALQIANASIKGQLSFFVYNFHFQEYEDSEYAIDQPIRPLNEDEIEDIQSNTSWWLDSRTRGLLELNPESGTVAFLHRTVRDFLRTQEIHDFLTAKVDSRLNFSPVLSILKAHIAMIKTSILPHQITRKIDDDTEAASIDVHKCHKTVLNLVQTALEYAYELESLMSCDVRHHALLDELDRTISSDNRDAVTHPFSVRQREFFREGLLDYRIFDYLRSKLDSEPDFLKDVGSVPVLSLLQAEGSGTGNIERHRGRGTDILVHLLNSRGIDPNKSDDSRVGSPWSQLFDHVCDLQTSDRKSTARFLSLLLEEGILKLFLIAGADPGAKIDISTSDTEESKVAMVIYLDLCFDIRGQSPQIRALYLDVLSEFLRVSSDWLLRNATNEFCEAMSSKDKSELREDLPFLAEVTDMLRLSLGARESYTEATLEYLDRMSREIFPLNLYAPINATTETTRGKRKQQSSVGSRRKKKRSS